jgi:hypothetical protein
MMGVLAKRIIIGIAVRLFDKAAPARGCMLRPYSSDALGDGIRQCHDKLPGQQWFQSL